LFDTFGLEIHREIPLKILEVDEKMNADHRASDSALEIGTMILKEKIPKIIYNVVVPIVVWARTSIEMKFHPQLDIFSLCSAKRQPNSSN